MKQNTNVNQLKIGVILSYLITGINMLIQLIYTPVMIRLLGQSEYGLYTLVGSVVSYLSLFSLGFTGAYLRFYSRYESRKDEDGVARLNGMFLVMFLLMSVAALVCGMILSCFTEQLFGSNLTAGELKTAGVLMRFLVVNIALTFPSSLFNSMISAHEQFLFQRILNLASIICNPFICLPLLIAGYGSVAVVAVTTAITFIKLIVDAWYCLKKLHIRFDFSRFEFSLLKEIGSFSFFLFLNMIIDQINWSVDKFILGRVSGTTAVAVYGVGAQINSLYTLFSTSISSVFAPRVNRIAASKSNTMLEEFTALFIKVGRIQSLVLFLVASGFVIFGKFFITDIYTTEEYAMSYPVALLLILPVTVPLIQNLGIEIQRAVNKHQARAVIYFAMAIINTCVSIPLGTLYGPVGCALGTAGSLLIANGLIMNIYYHKAIGIDMIAFWKSILSLSKGMIIPCVVGAFIMYFIEFRGIMDFAIWVMVYTAVYCGSMWIFGMNQYEKDLIMQPIKKLIRK